MARLGPGRAARVLDPREWEGHPALAAWGQLGGGSPRSVAVVKEETESERLSRIYRLEGTPAGAPVIAKRGRAEAIDVERRIYDQVLRSLELRALRCLGSVPDADPRFAWIFLDAADGVAFDAASPDHRAAAGSWLAALHAGTEGHPILAQLPDRGPGHYLAHLLDARERIARSFDNPVLREPDRELLDAILRGLDVVESRWAEVEAACAEAPRVLVHGDFAARNVRVEGEGRAAQVWVFDWEVAGRGAPGIDLVRADAEAYRSAVGDRWPGLDVPQQARIGRLLRGCLAPIGWDTLALHTPWVERFLYGLASYRQRLDEFFGEAGWMGAAAPPRALPPDEDGGAAASEHPAVCAWRRLGGSEEGLHAVELLRRKQRSQVYRLRGVGPGASAVAKRTLRRIGAVERCLYEQVLPRLPLRSLGFLGAVEEGDACWLFLEDAGPERLAGDEGRRLLTRWLATFHTGAADLAPALPLPPRGADLHRGELRGALHRIAAHLDNPALRPADRWLLRSLGTALAQLDEDWGAVASLCTAMPTSVVHGDLGPRNLHLRRGATGDEAVVLDWETAGVGPIAVDLADVDPVLYARLVAQRWPRATAEDVATWQHCGRLLRAIVATAWEAPELAHPWIEQPMARLRIYRRDLDQARLALGLGVRSEEGAA